MTEYGGCGIDSLGDDGCRRWVYRATGGEDRNSEKGELLWLLALCHDGVVWGRFDGANGGWRLSSTPFPDLCPSVSTKNLLEMRLFGPDREVLIWRSEVGFRGRDLRDLTENGGSGFLKPENECRILLGNRFLYAKDGFTRVSAEGGRQQAVPLECPKSCFDRGRWPLRLTVRHYFQQEPDTGAVRVAVTRLINMEVKT